MQHVVLRRNLSLTRRNVPATLRRYSRPSLLIAMQHIVKGNRRWESQHRNSPYHIHTSKRNCVYQTTIPLLSIPLPYHRPGLKLRQHVRYHKPNHHSAPRNPCPSSGPRQCRQIRLARPGQRGPCRQAETARHPDLFRSPGREIMDEGAHGRRVSVLR